jgi:hypothetical protein
LVSYKKVTPILKIMMGYKHVDLQQSCIGLFSYEWRAGQAGAGAIAGESKLYVFGDDKCVAVYDDKPRPLGQ